MGSHTDGASIAAAAHTSVFAVSATYTAPDLTGGAVDIIKYPVRTERRDSSAGIIEVQVREIIVESADIGLPAINAIFSIDGQSWSVERRESEPSGRWKLTLVKTDAIEVNRASYRRGAR